eukprot:g2162.t1
MLHQISENEINVRNNTTYPRNTIKINNKIIEKIYTSKTTSTQTVKDRDDRMCELMERAFQLELANKKLKKIVSSEHKNTIKLRSELIKLRTRDAIMKSKMDETKRHLMEQTSRYNILQEQIQQVVSLAAIGSVNNNNFSSPTRTTSRVSFSSTTFPNTPKMPVCGIEDDIMSPVREEEEGEQTNGIDVLNANNNKNNMNDSHSLSTSNSSSMSSAAIDIPQKLKGPQSPLPENSNTGATTVNTAFSYIDAMRFLMSPPRNNSLLSGGVMENKYGSMYGTTPLTNEQLNFQQIITNAETNAMKQKIEVVKEMYKKENNELKLRIANLEQRVKVTEEKASKYQHELAKANVVIEEQNKVLKSTKSVMTSFGMLDEHNNHNGKSVRRNSKTGSRRISQMKLIHAKVNNSRSNQQMLFESSGGGRKGYYGRLGVF